MSKTKSTQGTVAATAAAAVETISVETAETTAVEAVEVQPSETTEETKAAVAVCAFAGTEALMEELWRKALPDVALKVVTVEENEPLTDLLARLVADEDLQDEFIYVPANCVPCGKTSLNELYVPLVFRDARGDIHYSHRLPVPVNKDAMVEILGGEITGDEDIMKAYFTGNLGRPVEAAFKEGNIVTPVLRGNPCEHVVLEALIRKKYIAANAVGFAAITPLLQKTLV